MPSTHPLKHKRFSLPGGIDKAVLLVAVAEPLMTLPQIIEIYSSRSALNVSALTWSFYILSAVVWLIYAVIHKNRPLIIASSLWILFESMVVIGTIIFE